MRALIAPRHVAATLVAVRTALITAAVHTAVRALIAPRHVAATLVAALALATTRATTLVLVLILVIVVVRTALIVIAPRWSP